MAATASIDPNASARCATTARSMAASSKGSPPSRAPTTASPPTLTSFEPQSRVMVIVDAPIAFDRQAGRVAVEEKQREAVAVGDRAGRARRDDEPVRVRPVDREILDARKNETVTMCFGGRRHHGAA